MSDNTRVDTQHYIDDNINKSIDFILDVMNGYSYSDLVTINFLQFYELLFRASSKNYNAMMAMKDEQNKFIDVENGLE